MLPTVLRLGRHNLLIVALTSVITGAFLLSLVEQNNVGRRTFSTWTTQQQAVVAPSTLFSFELWNATWNSTGAFLPLFSRNESGNVSLLLPRSRLKDEIEPFRLERLGQPTWPTEPLPPRPPESTRVNTTKDRPLLSPKRPEPFPWRRVEASFIVHVPALTERRAYLDDYFSKSNYTGRVFWVTEFNVDELEDSFVRPLFTLDAQIRKERAFYTAKINGSLKKDDYHTFPKVDGPGKVSLKIKMGLVWEAIAYLDLNCALVLEDDVRFMSQDSLTTLDAWLSQMDPATFAAPWVIWPGRGSKPLGFGSGGRMAYSLNLQYNTLKRSHYGDTYVLNAAAAMALLTVLPPFALPFDWEFTYAMNAANITTFWTTPKLTRQGSGFEYDSVLRNQTAKLKQGAPSARRPPIPFSVPKQQQQFHLQSSGD